MMKAIIEMPEGDDRRRHFKYDKTGFIDLGLIKDVIPVNDGIMPVHYGFITETWNEKEGDEIDVLVLSDKELVVGQEVQIEPIALMRRADGDDKIVAVDVSGTGVSHWNEISKEKRDLIEQFFSYHHKFTAIEDSQTAIDYIEEGRREFANTQAGHKM